MPNFIEIEETFCGQTDGRTLRPALLGQLCQRVDLKIMAQALVGHGGQLCKIQQLQLLTVNTCHPQAGARGA